MKKLGIVTFYNAHNYGAMLQAMALQDYFKENEEIDSYIINYRNQEIDDRYKLNDWSNLNIKKILKNIYKYFAFSRKLKKRSNSFEQFLNENFNLTQLYKSDTELKENYPKFDYYVTGSDQVWNYKITNGINDIYTLNFGNKETVRFSYAASIGNDKFDKKYEQEYVKKLDCLNNISVREKSAQHKLEKILNREVFEVVDPTLLMDKEYWKNKVEKCNKKEKEKYILAYQVDPNSEYNKIVDFISNELGLKVIHFERRNNNYNRILRSAYTEGPMDFVRLIKDAEFVINTSFHGTVFSTIFHKKFLVIPHKETGSRMIDYLDKIGLSDRIIYKYDELNKIDYNNEIDYKKVDEKIGEERKKSREFIKIALAKK